MPLLFIAAMLSPYVAAQNTTFDPNSVDQTTKNQWCQSQIDNCLLLCGGDGSTQENACQSGTLQYTCTCLNMSSPANIAQYQGTIPNYICQRVYSQCTASIDNLNSSERCQKCGMLQPSNVLRTASPENSPAKIGVGVGVSLGVVFFAIFIAGLVLIRRQRNRRSRLEDKGNGGGTGKSCTTNEPVLQELDDDGDRVLELDAIESPPHSRELTGSPGPLRSELE